MRRTRPIWARLSVRILVGFLAVPQMSAFPKDALFLVPVGGQAKVDRLERAKLDSLMVGKVVMGSVFD